MPILDVSAPGQLLDAVYADILTPTFPTDELITATDLHRGVTTGTTIVCAAVDNTGQPAAAAVCDWYADSGVLLLLYLAARPAQRGAGHGSALLRHVRDEWLTRLGGSVLLAEIEHPHVHPGSDAYGDPVARLRFYHRHGGRVLNVPYFQPAYGGGQRVYGLLLTALAHTDAAVGSRPGTISPEPIREFLTQYFTDCEGHVGADPATAALWRDLDRPGGIDLLPLDDLAALPLSTP